MTSRKRSERFLVLLGDSHADPNELLKYVLGRAPLIARQTVRIVMSVLSAIGSMTVPTTVCRFHRLAM